MATSPMMGLTPHRAGQRRYATDSQRQPPLRPQFPRRNVRQVLTLIRQGPTAGQPESELVQGAHSLGAAGTKISRLRHTCVSLLLAEGAPPHVVQQIAGHTAIDVTIYAHASLDEKWKALTRLGEALI